MKFSVKFLFIGILLPLSNLFASTIPSLEESVENVIQHTAPNAYVGVVVSDAETGRILYERNGLKAFTPASNLKILTSAAALFSLGKEYRYRTSVLANKGKIKENQLHDNVYIKFSGDPELTTKDLKKLVAQLKRNGVHTINCNIVIDDSLFKKPNYAPGWPQDDVDWYFAAPVSAIILNQNNVHLEVMPHKTLGKRVSIIPHQDTPSIHIRNQVETVTYDQAMEHCTLILEVDSQNNIYLGGCWPLSNEATTFNIAIKTPWLLARETIQIALKKNNIHLKGKIVRGKAPLDVKVIAEHKSNELRHIIPTILKDSNNLYSESLLKTLGNHKYGNGNFNDGVNAVKNILSEKANLRFEQSMIFDGSGLSPYNLISPRQIVKLLYVMYHSKELGALFMKSLPAGGEKGTLKKRMNGFPLSNRLRAKTGTMKGVASLSGYLTTRNNKTFIFSIITNGNVVDRQIIQKMEEEICDLMVKHFS